MKQAGQIVVVFSFFAVLITSCKKENAGKEVFSINPQMLTSYAGKNWHYISPDVENKKDYLYTTLNLGNTLAAISLPAIDPQTPGINYKVLFNVNQQNSVSVIHLETVGSLDVKTGNTLFLYYYENAFKQMETVNRKWVTFNYSQTPPITVDELVAKLKSFNCEQPSVSFNNSRMNMEAIYSQNNGGFSFNIYAP